LFGVCPQPSQELAEMPDWISKLFDPIKEIFPFIRSHYLAITSFFALVSWLLIFLPASALAVLGIDSAKTTYLSIIGSVAFLTTIFLLFRLIYQVYFLINQKQSANRERQRRQELLDSLTSVERQYLNKYIDNQSQTATFTVYDGVVAGLIDKGLLYKTNTQTNRAGEQDFNIYPWAYDSLKTAANSAKGATK
jgi:hypothetical protein